MIQPTIVLAQSSVCSSSKEQSLYEVYCRAIKSKESLFIMGLSIMSSNYLSIRSAEDAKVIELQDAPCVSLVGVIYYRYCSFTCQATLVHQSAAVRRSFIFKKCCLPVCTASQTPHLCQQGPTPSMCNYCTRTPRSNDVRFS
jgi:hypothetical protein